MRAFDRMPEEPGRFSVSIRRPILHPVTGLGNLDVEDATQSAAHRGRISRLDEYLDSGQTAALTRLARGA